MERRVLLLGLYYFIGMGKVGIWEGVVEIGSGGFGYVDGESIAESVLEKKYGGIGEIL